MTLTTSLNKVIHKVIYNPLLLQSIISLIARFTGVILNFAVIQIMTNNLEKSVAGDIMLLMTFITGVALISRLGIDQLLMKEVAGAHHDDLSFKQGFLKTSYTAVFLLSILFIAIWSIASPYVQHSFFHDGTHSTISLTELLFAGLGILFFNVVIINSTYLKAIKNTVLGVLGQNALTAVTFLLLIGLFWIYFINHQYITYLYTVSLIFAGILSVICLFFVLNKHAANKSTLVTPEKTVFDQTIPDLKTVFKQSLPLAPISIISFLMIFTDTIMVGWFLLNDQVAEYSLASKISYIILFFLQAMEATIYPRLLNIFKQAQNRLHAFFWQSTVLVVTVVLSTTGVMYLLSDWILLKFGSEYTTAKNALAILLLAQLLRAASITFSFMFIIREKVKYLNRILFTAFTLNVIANIQFIQWYGIEGAALATLAANATLLLLVLIFFYYHKLLTIRDIKA